MSRFKFSTTDKGKCDVTITLFTKDNSILAQRNSTFDVKPTVKELKAEYKQYKPDAKLMRISTMPSGMVKTYKL
jgi:hypothetical protein